MEEIDMGLNASIVINEEPVAQEGIMVLRSKTYRVTPPKHLQPQEKLNNGVEYLWEFFSKCFGFTNMENSKIREKGETWNNNEDEFDGESEIVSSEELKTLCCKGVNCGIVWKCVFSTSRDGFSLQSLYRKCSVLAVNSPILLLIKDKNGRVFGARVNQPFRISSHFYGSGPSFIFRFAPNLEIFHWSGLNNYFIKGNVDSLIVGSGDGKFGIWLDNDLNKGFTDNSETFSSPPLVSEGEFQVTAIECWVSGI